MLILRKLFEILLFFTLMIYCSGGIVIAGKAYLGYITDFLNALAAVGAIAVLSGVSLMDVKLVRGFDEITQTRHHPISVWRKFAIALICYWVILFFIDPIVDHRAHLTGLYDLGLMEQIIWRNANNLGPTSTILGSAQNPFNYVLNNHLNLWLYPISCVYKIFPTTETLIVLKSLAILLCIIPLWKIARVLWGEKVPAILLPLFLALGLHTPSQYLALSRNPVHAFLWSLGLLFFYQRKMGLHGSIYLANGSV